MVDQTTTRLFSFEAIQKAEEELEECGCCSSYHRKTYDGDCRNDYERFASPEEYLERKRAEHLTYAYDANGYVLFYKTKRIGGAGVRLPRSKPLHWQHRRKNLALFREQAEQAIDSMKRGRWEERFRQAINEIDGEHNPEG